VAVVGIVLALPAGGAGDARPAAVGAGLILPPTPQGGGLDAVQCWAVGECLAVGGSAKGVLVDRLSGTRWSIVPAPNPVGRGGATPTLIGLSCIGSRWCLAVGRNRCGGPLAERWNGHRWSLAKLDLGDLPMCGIVDGIGDVSCASRSFCMAVGGVGVAQWDGTAWLSPAGIESASHSLTAVSCPARDDCAGVGEDEYEDNSVGWWNGHVWRFNDQVAGDARFAPTLDDISCPSVRFCMAVGSTQASDGTAGSGEAVEWNGSRWGDTAYPSPLTGPVAVSCVSRTECTTVNAYSPGTRLTTTATSIATFNGRGWTTTASAFHADPTAISCPVTGWCMVVGLLLNPKTGSPLTPAAASVQ